MEISAVSENTIKIKGKNVNFLIDPTAAIQKISADAVLFLKDTKDSDSQVSKVTDARVIIKGPGSFEIGGARVSSIKSNGNFFHSINIDGLNIFLGTASGFEKQEEKGSCNILILNMDGDFKESMVSSFEPSVVVIYGEKSDQALKALGKVHQTISKFSQTVDKLPVDTQVVLLK